ncbi:MAG: pilus assembly protein PilM [Smithellaceae bacterium]
MADKNEINSTEKLLNAIRGKQEEVNNEIGSTSILLPKELPVPQKSKKLSRFFPGKKNYTVGIDISHDFIHLAKTISSSDGSPILIDQKIIKASVDKGSPEFNSLLKASLLSICGNPADCNIWTIIPAGEVNIQHVKIPPVPKKQMENAIYWAAKKELSFDEKDYIFDFEIQGDIVEQGIPKHSVMVYSAPKAEIEKCKALFSNIGISLAGITIAPFAIQNIFRTKWLLAGEGTTATLFIGHEFSRISIYDKDNLLMTRGIKTGASSMMEAIAESFLEKKGALRLEKEDVKKILFSLGSDSEKLSQNDAGFGLKSDEIFKMLIPVIERLTRQIERTLQHYTTSIGNERVEKIYISSAINIYDPIAAYISDQLGIVIETFDPFKHQAASRVAEGISPADRMSLVPALGLSFSDNKLTPNLILTYKEKNQEISIIKINRGIFAASAVALVICIMTIIYQGLDVSALNKQRANLKREVSMFNPLISAEKVIKLADDVKMQRHISRQYAERYLGMAAIGEISALTPANIRLNNLTIVTSVTSAVRDKPDKTAKEETTEGLTLEGIITGERNMLDSYLAQYIMKLNNSPMLRQVSVYKNNIVNFKKNDVLQFTISAKIGK